MSFWSKIGLYAKFEQFDFVSFFDNRLPWIKKANWKDTKNDIKMYTQSDSQNYTQNYIKNGCKIGAKNNTTNYT